MTRLLVTGALGQVGTELVQALRARYGTEEVLASDVRPAPAGHPAAHGPFVQLDVLNEAALRSVVHQRGVQQIYHLAALLSAVAEQKPELAWQLNMQSLIHVLDVAREAHCRVFAPSSIAVFGPDTPRHAPQLTVQRPRSMYGVTKVAGELLCDDYLRRYGVDVRGLRYPGLISSSAPAGGGTTDYAVDIFHAAVKTRRYTCFLSADTALEMMYMPDAVRATLELMDAPAAALRYPNAYNLAGVSFSPAQLACEIAKQQPGFQIAYAPDPVRQAIADGWPDSIDDAAARHDWGWQPRYDLSAITTQMLRALTPQDGPYVA